MDNEARGIVAYDGEAGPVQTYLARPSAEEPRPAVIVIHEIVGLTEHIKRVADRFAEKGYVAFAPNLFSRPGLAEVLTPSNVGAVMQFTSTLGWARMSDPAAVQQAMSQLPQERREDRQRWLLLWRGYVHQPGLSCQIGGKRHLLWGESTSD